MFWKVGLWLAVALLPGGVLLLPVIYALHRRERARLSAAAAARDATPRP